MDFLFMGEETGGEGLVVERIDLLPWKTMGEFVSQGVVAFMKELGCEMSVVTLKTDNEPALVAVADDVEKAPSGLSWRIVWHILPREME